MRDEESKLDKALKESEELIQKGKECVRKLANKYLPKDTFVTPTDGDGSEKKMIGKIL